SSELGIEEVFKRVRISVRNLTQGKQVPWESSSLIGDFHFVKTDAVVPTPQTTSPSVDPLTIELTYWDTVKKSTNPEDYQAYLRKYPDGQFADLAKNRLKTLETKQ